MPNPVDPHTLEGAVEHLRNHCGAELMRHTKPGYFEARMPNGGWLLVSDAEVVTEAKDQGYSPQGEEGAAS